MGMQALEIFVWRITYQFLACTTLSQWKKSALSVDGKYRKPALDIATALNTHPELLFNEEQKHFSLTKNSGFVEMNSKEVQELITSTCSETYLIEHASDVINKVFDNLSPREKKLLNWDSG